MLEGILLRKHLADDEEVVAIIHKHWFMGVGSLFWPSIAFFTSWAALILAPHPIVFYIAAFGAAASALWWVRSFLDYYLDAWIITNQGIIDLDWQGFFRRKSSRMLYSDVQGVSYEIQGVMATLFRYGTVTVEKISTGTTISLPYIQKPKKVEAKILTAMEAYLHTKNLKDATHVQEILSSIVTEQMQQKQMQEEKKKKMEKASKRTPFLSRTLS